MERMCKYFSEHSTLQKIAIKVSCKPQMQPRILTREL